MEKQNKPTVTIYTDRFLNLGQTVRASLGMPKLPMVVIPHPVGGLKEEEVVAKADKIIGEIIEALTGR